MGCWGITAFESDAGLDAVGFVRENFLGDGKLELERIIEALRQDEWNAPPAVSNSGAHTSPMALAEIMMKFIDRNMDGLDYNEEWAVQENKFSNITSFRASRESIQWLRDYISDSLQYARERADHRSKWNGWFEEKNWVGWQAHMEMLVSRLDTLLVSPESHMELLPSRQ